MRSHFPPLNAVKTFEVAARKLSFSKAADELCVTQGAVSKQIQTLEKHLEVSLFKRTATGLELTEEGRQYLPPIAEAMHLIQGATSLLQQQRHQRTLNISLSPSFSNLWLIPRLSELQSAHPDIHLAIASSDETVRFTEGTIDAAIRCLPLSPNYENSTLLVAEQLLPIIHPSRLAAQPIEQPEDLLHHPLLLHITRPQIWTAFLNNVLGNEHRGQAPHYSTGFEHFYMSYEAIRQGQGIGLLPHFMVERELAEGELVNPLGIRYTSGYGFYLQIPAFNAQSSRIYQFKQWLEEQLRAA